MEWEFHFPKAEEDPLTAFLNVQEAANRQDGSEAEEGPDKKKKRLARNRESARNSRRKKKQYIEFLEGRVARLSEEVGTLKAIISSTTSTSPDQLFRARRKELFQKLSDAVNNQQVPDHIVAEMLNDLREQLGVHARGRQEVVNRMFQQTLELMIPLHVKYFLWVSDQELDFFQEAGGVPEDYASWQELVTTAQFTPEQCAAIREYKGILLQEKDKMSESLLKLKGMREALESKSLSFQQYLEDLRQQLEPRQAASFALWIEEHVQLPAAEQVLSHKAE